MKALVLIPTTNRPVIVTGIRERRALPASLVVADGDFRTLGISADYDKLIGVAGPLGGLLGAAGLPSHELRLSQPFETGRSWEVPVCLAHVLVSRGVRLVKDPAEADLVVWATGAVDIDLGIVKDRYFLGQKLDQSRPLLASVRAGVPVIALVPAGAFDGDGGAEGHAVITGRGGHVASVATVPEAVAAIEAATGLKLSASAPHPVGPPDRAPAPKTRLEGRQEDGPGPRRQSVVVEPAPRQRRGIGGLMLLMSLAALAGGGWVLARNGHLDHLATYLRVGPPAGPVATVPPPGSPASVTKKGDGEPAKAPQMPNDGAVATAASGPGSPTAKTAGKPQPKGDGTSGAGLPDTPSKVATGPAGPAGTGPVTDGAPKVTVKTDLTVEPPRKPNPDDELLIIEEQRAPAGRNCKQIAFGGHAPEIFILKPRDGRFAASDVSGLCALVYRRLDAAAQLTLTLDVRLVRATADKAEKGRDRLRPGDHARVLRDDFGQGFTYSIRMKAISPGSDNRERVYVHELRR